MKILITTAYWKSALTVMRSLAKRGHQISLIGDDASQAYLHSKFCHEAIVSPLEHKKEQYVPFLLNLLKEKKFDLLIPISDICIDYVLEHEEEIRKHVGLYLSSPEQMRLARNKDLTYRFAIKHGIPIPETFFPETLDDVQQIASKIKFPCVIKKSKGTGGSGNSYPTSKEELISCFRNYSDRPWPVIQEFVQGRHAGFKAVCHQGKILSCFMSETLRQFPDSGGITVYATSIFHKQSFECLERLIKDLRWDGIIDFDFFITKEKGFQLLEINPRFAGSIQFAYNCGVDLPFEYLEVFEGRIRTQPPKMYPLHLYYRPIFPEEIRSCAMNPRHIPAFFINFLKLNTTYDFSFLDPQLLLWQIKNAKWDVNNLKIIKKLNHARSY